MSVEEQLKLEPQLSSSTSSMYSFEAAAAASATTFPADPILASAGATLSRAALTPQPRHQSPYSQPHRRSVTTGRRGMYTTHAAQAAAVNIGRVASTPPQFFSSRALPGNNRGIGGAYSGLVADGESLGSPATPLHLQLDSEVMVSCRYNYIPFPLVHVSS